jgi:predicted anti-sigma-YlaC factor YlaD
MGTMSECDEILEQIVGGSSADEVRFQRHAARCSHCREQLNVEGKLRDLFQGVAPAGPSLHFNRELSRRLDVERERQRRQRRRLLVMRGYWVAAALASLFVISLVRWPEELPSMAVLLAVGTALGMALLAPLILLLSLRIGPLGLLLGTVEELRKG